MLSGESLRIVGRVTVDDARRRLGRIGVWLQAQVLRSGSPESRRQQMARIEELGYRSLWTGETPGGSDVFVQLTALLGATDRLVAGTGIANVWSRPAVTASAATRDVVESFPDRFVLGLGVGYPAQAEIVGAEYGKPLATMRHYLDTMAATTTPTVLAAVGPKMLALAAERTDGAHPYAQPVANTAVARKVLGPDKLLIPEVAVALHADPAVARRTAREYKELGRAITARIGITPTTSAYGRNLIRLGYTPQDVENVSDRYVDDTVAHGDEARVADRVREHLAAGADHVLVHPVEPDLTAAVDTLARLAPALMEL